MRKIKFTGDFDIIFLLIGIEWTFFLLFPIIFTHLLLYLLLNKLLHINFHFWMLFLLLLDLFLDLFLYNRYLLPYESMPTNMLFRAEFFGLRFHLWLDLRIFAPIETINAHKYG
jgi:hypothetical protein